MSTFIKSFKIFWPFCFHQNSRRFFFLSLLVMGADIGAVAYLPYAFKDVLEFLQAPPVTSGLLTLCIFYIAFSIATKILGFLQDLLFFPVINTAVRELHFRIPDHIQDISMEHYKKLSVPEIISYQKRIGQSARFFLRSFLTSIIPTLIKIIVAGVIIYNLNVFRQGLLLGIFTLITLFPLAVSWYVRMRAKAWTTTDQVTLAISDQILNTRLVRYYRTFAQEKIRTMVNKEYDIWWRVNSRMDLFQILMGFVMGLMGGLLITVSAFAVKNGTLSLGQFVLLNGQLVALLAPLRQMIIDFRMMFESSTDIEKIADVLSLPTEKITAQSSLSLKTIQTKAAIIFKDVTFSHLKHKPLFKDISLTIEQGDRTLIFGVTGVGKSTLLSLMTGLLTPTHGSIELFEQDISTLSLEDLGKYIHFIPQENQLFNDTFYNNLTFGVFNPQSSEIEGALDATLLKDFVNNLPQGLHTSVGDMGTKLSGGERQRLAFARALLLKPKILIFDETTNAMDIETERKVFENIEKKIETLIFISHRASHFHALHKKYELKNGELFLHKEV